MTDDLTVIETQTLRAIEDYYDRTGIMPSVRDLVAATDMRTTSHAAYVLRSLEAKWRIRRVPRAARGIVFIEEAGLDELYYAVAVEMPPVQGIVGARYWRPCRKTPWKAWVVVWTLHSREPEPRLVERYLLRLSKNPAEPPAMPSWARDEVAYA